MTSTTSVALYRLGNAAGPRMDHVREKDIEHFERDGVVWVRAGTGGISTSEMPGPMNGIWWRLAAGYDHGPMLLVWNDYDRHWSWEPADDVPLVEYREALGASHHRFVRLEARSWSR